MNANSWVMLRVLVNRFHSSPKDSFHKALPSEVLKEILHLDVSSKDATLAFLRPAEILKKIHYSWLIPSFEKIPKAMQSSILSSLPELQFSKIHAITKIPLSSHVLAPKVQSFLLNQLFSYTLSLDIHPSLILPIEYLPRTLLTPLSDLNKNELLELMDLLGLYDLAEEIRTIIDQKRLKILHASLSLKKRQFLAKCLHKKEKITSPSLKLEQWDGDSNKLEQILHKRGMLRLAKGLCGQHPDLLWHIVHTLDKGRGSFIQERFSKEIVPNVTPFLVQQIVNVLGFLKKSSAHE